MKCFFLAAGRGSRMGSLTNEVPKGLTPLGNSTIIEHQISSLRSSGVSDIAIITGYKNNAYDTLKLETIYNPLWNKGNMLTSIYSAIKSYPDTPLLFSYSDIICSPYTITSLIDNKQSPISLVYDLNWLSLWSKRFISPLDDAEVFQLDENSRVLKIGGHTGDLNNINGQFMGLFFIDRLFARELFHLLEENQNVLLNYDTTKLFSLLINQGHSIYAIPTNHPWAEIDSESDLAIAEAIAKIIHTSIT